MPTFNITYLITGTGYAYADIEADNLEQAHELAGTLDIQDITRKDITWCIDDLTIESNHV